MNAPTYTPGSLVRARGRDWVMLPIGAVAILGLSPTLRLTRLDAAHAPDLAWHRDHVFRDDQVREVTQEP